jgi:hypothetical protein
MAKTVIVNVKVDDTDFKAFQARFTAFSAQIGNLNNQFKSINTTIQKAQANAKSWVDILKSSYTVISTIIGGVAKVTQGFMRWGVTIGGIVSMLTTGAGLFGIDRLAQSVMQRRRLAMGIGADYGRTQGAIIAGSTIVDDPKALLQSISRGVRGAPAEQAGLAMLGVKPGQETDPTKAMGTVLMNLWERIHGLPEKGKLPVGRALRGGLNISDEDITRIGGMKTREEITKFIEKQKEIAKQTDMSEKAQDAWADLYRVFQSAKVAIESAFGEGLVKLTGPLGDLSQKIVDLIKALFNSGTVAKILDLVSKMLTKIATKISSEEFKKSLEHWDEEIKKWVPTLREVTDALNLFKDILLGIYHFMKNLGILTPLLEKGADRPDVSPPKPRAPGAPDTWRIPLPGTEPGGSLDKPKSWMPNWLDKLLGGKGTLPGWQNLFGSTPQQQQQQSPPAPDSQKQGSFNFGGTTQLASFMNQPHALTGLLGGGQFSPSVQNVAFSSPTTSADGGMSTSITAGGGGGRNFFAASSGGDLIANQSVLGAPNFAMGTGTNISPSFIGGDGGTSNFAFRGGGRNIGIGGRGGMLASIRGGNRIAMFGGAARGMTPGNEMNAFSRGGISSGNFSVASADNRRYSGSRGPLDMDNWQINKTPSLTIRSVPGSNVYAQANAMSG